VLGGYSDVQIANNTSYNIVIKRLDAADRGVGKAIIKDPQGLQRRPARNDLPAQVRQFALRKSLEMGRSMTGSAPRPPRRCSDDWLALRVFGRAGCLYPPVHHPVDLRLAGIDAMSPDPADSSWGEVVER